MAWENTDWACGHSGSMQLYGPGSGREATVAREAGRQCMACWLVERWEADNDPRAKRKDRYQLARKIAEGKGKRINGLPDDVAIKENGNSIVSLQTERARLIARISEIDTILNN